MLEQLPELIDRLDERRDLWGDEWDALQAAAAGLEAGSLRAEQIGAFGVLTHASGEPEAPGPLLARCFLPGAKRYLLAFEREGGIYDYRYERPRYAWADTVIRPALAPPDGAVVARAMGPEWTSEGLPGMTGICRTERVVADRPEAVAAPTGRSSIPVKESTGKRRAHHGLRDHARPSRVRLHAATALP